MDRPMNSRTSPISQEALTTTNGSSTRPACTPLETQLALARSAELQAIQERLMQLQERQEDLTSGRRALRMAATTVNGLSQLLSQILPHDPTITSSHMGAINSGRADGVKTIVTLEFFVEEE